MSENLDYITVYGDSYSDIHPATRKTNGPVWSQQLAKSWSAQLVSKAVPGATFCQNNKINGSWLQKQVHEDITLNDKDKSTVQIIFLGITDLIETKGQATSDIKQWIQCIEDQVKFLYSVNPNSRIILMGVPALEFSPYAMTHKSSTTNLKQNIIEFNVALEEQILDWRAELSDQIEFFDTYLVFSDILGDPSVLNMDNVDDAYWDKCQGQCTDAVDSYLWWDSVHVTGTGHKAISNTIQSKEFFNLQASLSESEQATTLEKGMTGLPQQYIRCLSWFILGAIIAMIFYMFRHNRVIISLKKKLQTKAAKIYSPRNTHEYTLV
ncbi:uncharacterized protein B0P05DRAFT_560812 [Gilbertella persicaria]|uniref:SGNH hydrolase-type esterase domain-containing protein n=1 Tax=Rhizopus stolonifer TaxID=4846 RepID=A0A367KMA3_RHIST|nr:uncharacterized protein B0P05DRAFT_560812 [Gilbertella persicaria]KAI8054933.1 hypothetical protein B0P05DRAFT_560812 [Gilbertella persicaria]RCI03307.1 hypothetical protein CU098_008265 [Rhizopus stolonifer]